MPTVFPEAMYEQLKQFPYAKTVERLHICCSSVEHVGCWGFGVRITAGF